VHCYKILSCFCIPLEHYNTKDEKARFQKRNLFLASPHNFYLPVHRRSYLTFPQCRKSLVLGASQGGAENSVEKFVPYGGNVFCSMQSLVCVAKFIIWPYNSCPWISLYIFFLFFILTLFRPDSADGTERTARSHQGHTRASLPSRHGYHGSGKAHLGSCEANLGSSKGHDGSSWLM
jgi:hypothetical protein